MIFLKHPMLLLLNTLASITRILFQKNRTTILVYHTIEKKIFYQHINILKKSYTIISLEQFLQFKNGEVKKLPPYSLVITFDDGYKENFDLMEIIERENIEITIFLCAGLINTNRICWSGYKMAESVVSDLLKLPYKEALQHCIDKGFKEDHEYPERTYLNWDEINKMKKKVNFQSHTHSHSNLGMSSEERIKFELSESKKILESQGLKINTICYPFSIYNSKSISIAKEVGYKYGISVEPFYNTKKTDDFRLKRISINATPPEKLLIKVSGLFTFIKEIILNKIKMRRFIN